MALGVTLPLPPLALQRSEEPRFLHAAALPQPLPSQQPLPPREQEEQEELDFLFDEELEQMDGRKNTFTAWSDEDSDYEIDDRDVNKILIVTQTPPYMRRHPGGDRTGNHTSRAKMSAELAKVINDGLFYYEQDLWTEKFEPEYSQIKVKNGAGAGGGPGAGRGGRREDQNSMSGLGLEGEDMGTRIPCMCSGHFLSCLA